VKVVKKVGHLGESIKLQCPIDGYPTPFIEWTKVSLDFSEKLAGFDPATHNPKLVSGEDKS
jgi:hypothetical protein